MTEQQLIKTPWNKGLKGFITHTEESKEKIRISKLGNKNNMWKGNSVGYNALHSWIKRHKPKPNLCEDCKKESPYDLANISGRYLRNVKDYKWVCRRCHMIEDGRGKEIYMYAPDNKGVNNGQSKLDEKKVLEIRKLLKEGLPHKKIAEKFNVARVTITDINLNRRWEWLNDTD
jgi:hypothetical protein